MKLLPIRVCSAQKSSVKFGYLTEIYTCHMLQAFFKAFANYGYAVLSRKNGVCFSWEKTENYGDWQEKNKEILLDLLRKQALEPRFNVFCYVYWNPCPPRHNCFVKILRDAGFNVIEGRRLIDIKDLLLKQEPQQVESRDPSAFHDSTGFADLLSFAKRG